MLLLLKPVVPQGLLKPGLGVIDTMKPAAVCSLLGLYLLFVLATLWRSTNLLLDGYWGERAERNLSVLVLEVIFL
jgi:hypothetical protein